MKDLFTYLNYREFLRDYCDIEKAKNPAFSYRYFANKAGFKSKSFFYHVIEGKKNLSKESIYKIAKALKLDEKAFSFFEDLVAFTQSASQEQRNYYFEKISQYNRRNPTRVLQMSQYEFYSQWYHNTIRELVTIVDFQDDFTYLAALVRPSITPRQARLSVRLLQKLGLIKKVNGRYIQTDPSISTGDEVRDIAIQNFHIKNLAMAADMVNLCPPEERDISSMVVGLSSEGFRTAKKALQQFRKQIATIAENDAPAQRVYHINFQVIPTSISEKGKQV
jgi:uncharacterized protein (TIGR02147 family)